MSDPKQFALQVRGFSEKTKNKMDLVVRKIVLDIGTSLVMRSPVGDPSTWKHGAPAGYTGGHFRANWQYGEGVIPSGYLPSIDKSGAVSLSRISSGLAQKAAGKVHYLTNNLPYAMRLETGWSKQAPAGMVGLVVAEFRGIVARATAEVGR